MPEFPSGQAPRGTSSRAPRAATFGLAGVFVALAAFSIFAAYTTRTQLDRAEHAIALREAYDDTIAAIKAVEKAELEYHLEPSAEHRVALDAANVTLNDRTDAIVARGSQADRQLADDIRALHKQYLSASARLAIAILAGDTVEARRIDDEGIDPILHAMDDRIAAAAAGPNAESVAAFAALRSTAQTVLVLAPIVFALGFALLVLLWRILEQHQRATRKTYREIEQLSRLRSEFVSIVSHEFRTPLTGIQGFSEMMRDEELTVPQMREYAGDINKDARRLARLISDMLDLDRMESGRMTLESEPLNLNRIVADAAAQFRLSATDHPIELDLDEDLPTLMGDADRLTQVVTNLLSNAIKYSPSGGAVELKTVYAERTATLTVRDHGIGIPAEQLEKVFERYSRIQTTETRGIQGTGLGLPIVRQIVQFCGGRVWATSEPGRGSVFHVQLVLREAASVGPRAA